MFKRDVRIYSKEEREEAIVMYIKYDKSAAAVIRELCYPDKKTLVEWHKEYLETEVPFEPYALQPKYSIEQKKAAAD